MTKLKLKRTIEEEAQHQARKQSRRWRNRERREAGSSKRPRTNKPSSPTRKWASSDEEDNGRSQSRSRDDEAHQEEIRFREKMFDALGDEERLDGLEAQLNDFAHIPGRWGPSGMGKEKARAGMYEGDEYLRMDPNTMDDEEYAEWIRIGMYRKTHAEEYANQQRKKAERAAKKAEEKAQKIETKRLEKLAEDERKHLEEESRTRRLEKAREEYDSRWMALLASVGESVEGAELAFHDIPWPVTDAYRRRRTQCLTTNDFTANAISSFLFAGEKRDRRDKVREAIRRFHPDKFEGWFMSRVREQDQGMVLEGIGQVSRILNSLLTQ